MPGIADFFDPRALIKAGQDEVYAKLGGIISSITSGLSSLQTWLSSTIATAKKDAITAYQTGLDTVSKYKQEIASKIIGMQKYVTSSISTLGNVIISKLTSGLSLLDSAVGRARDSIMSTVSTTIKSITNNIASARAGIEKLGNMIMVNVLGAVAGVEKKADTILSILTTPEKLGNTLIKALEAVW